MIEQEEKANNTKGLIKKLGFLALIVSAYQFTMPEHSYSQAINPDTSVLKMDVETAQTQESTLSFSINVNLDLGPMANKIVRFILADY